MGFRCSIRHCCRTYVKSQSIGTLAALSASTVVLPVQYYWQYILDQGPALDIPWYLLASVLRNPLPAGTRIM